ncbi:MAG: fasciclin domain-containing protein [Acidimicrobiales bacterium]
MLTQLNPTKNRRTRRSAGGALLAGALILSACSSDGTQATAPATTAVGEPETTEVDMMGAFGPACAAVPAEGDGSFAGMADDTAATAASNNPLLSTLVSAVVAADLVDTLNSDGPFTIFAPTNDAFAAIPEDILNAVLADKDLLTAVLTYHVIPGESLGADELGAAGTEPTVESNDVMLSTDGTMVNDANVICSNVPVANGTVHIVDSVLLPPVALDAIAALTGESAAGTDTTEMSDSGEMAFMGATGEACAAVPAEGDGSFAGMADDTAATAASNNPLLSTLVSAVVAADLVDTLNSDGPFTIFAPTNDAFAALPPADLEAVLADTELLTSILTFHVIAGEKLSAADLIEAGTVTTVNGETLTFTASGEAVAINGSATTICQDVPTANATVHIIDGVLLLALSPR